MHDTSQDEGQHSSAEDPSSAEEERSEETLTLEQRLLDLHLAAENMDFLLRRPR